MIFRSIKKLAIAVALTGAVGAACADNSQLSFTTTEGAAFLNSFLVTPSETNKFEFDLSARKEDYTSLSFEIISGGFSETVVATKNDGKWTASFNDSNTKNFKLTEGNSYALNIYGFTANNKDQNNFGTYSFTVENGSIKMISAVPEPESYAMLLAGLGMVGTIVFRRSRANPV